MNAYNLDSKAKLVAIKYKQAEVELLSVLEELDQYKVFYKLGYPSLFKYCTDALKLSLEVTSIFINVARKTREIPKLKEEIANGSITVSKARRMTSVLNEKNQDHWFEVAKTKSKQKLEREVALASPRTAVRELLNYIPPGKEIIEKTTLLKLKEPRVQLQVGISEKTMLKLRRVEDVLSQKRQGPTNLETCLEVLCEEYLEKHDPLRKATRQKLRGKLKPDNAATPKIVPGHGRVKRLSLKIQLKHQLYLKYDGQCGHRKPNGERCRSRRFLEVHHKKPVSQGGGNELENLILLCGGHHKIMHKSMSHMK